VRTFVGRGKEEEAQARVFQIGLAAVLPKVVNAVDTHLYARAMLGPAPSAYPPHPPNRTLPENQDRPVNG